MASGAKALLLGLAWGLLFAGAARAESPVEPGPKG
jgi:hypothetical protein